MYWQVFLSMVFGSILGFILSLFGPHYMPRFFNNDVCRTTLNYSETAAMNVETSYGNKLLFIGVMTAAKYLDTRATAVNQTWASDIPGDIEFFVSFNKSRSVEGKYKQMPIRVLHGVADNEYPPQKKVMAMLKYMYENYIDQYEWFMRADDDVYVRAHKLTAFLRNLDSTEPAVIGQGGIGKSEEVNKLGLEENECYCLGGPGVIMSRNVLRRIAPNMEKCLNETASDHEDVELGRCIHKYAGVSCLWAHEAKELFQQVYKEQEKAYHGALNTADINKALTLHPVKDPAYMFRLHYYFMSIKLFKLHYREYKTNRILTTTKRILSGEISPMSFANRSKNTDFYSQANASSKLEWELLTQDKHSEAIQHFALENHKSHLMFKTAAGIKKALALTMHELNEEHKETLNRKTIKSKITFENINHGYLRVNPKYGVQYKLNLSIKFPHEPLQHPWRPPVPAYHRANVDQAFSTIQGRIQKNIKNITVNFLVPLRGKYEEFKKFLASLKEAFLIHREPIAVIIVYFPESSSPDEHIQHYKELKLEFPDTKFVWLEISGQFNRAKALQKGVMHLGNDSLLFFSDIDLVFRREFVYRCRGNTIQGKQVYMPLMFGQYNPDIVYFNKSKPTETNFVYTKPAGRWRIHSYGPVCIYGSDVMAVGGLNTNIIGWGKEDTDFARRVVDHGLTIFRAPDQGIVHVFHPHVPCDESLAKDQRFQCKKATLSTYAPKIEAVDYLIAKRYIE